MTYRKIKLATLVITLIAFGSLCRGANAAVTVLSDTVSSEVVFDFEMTQFVATRTTTSELNSFLLDLEDVYTTNIAFASGAFDLSASTLTMTFQVNSSPEIAVEQSLVRNGGTPLGGANGNLTFFFDLDSPITISRGDTITLNGTMRFPAMSLDAPDNIDRTVSTNFNQRPTIFQPAIASPSIQISSIPEPSSAVLLSISTLAFIARRKRIA